MQAQKEFALGQLDRVQAMFARVEGKASFLFALDVAMLAVLVSNLDFQQAKSWSNSFAAITCIFLAASLWNLYAAYAPNLAGAKFKSLLYFRDIASHDEDGYRAAVAQATDDHFISDALAQVWRNSEILERKFDRVQRAFTLTMIAVPTWLLLIAVASVRNGTVALGA